MNARYVSKEGGPLNTGTETESKDTLVSDSYGISVRHLLTPQQRLVKQKMSSLHALLCFLGQRS